MESAKEGGFFKIPSRLEGSVKSERTLREIEKATGTTIRMQNRPDEHMIVVLVIPDKTGEVGDVARAVERIKDLKTVAHQERVVRDGGGRGGGARRGRGAKSKS